MIGWNNLWIMIGWKGREIGGKKEEKIKEEISGKNKRIKNKKWSKKPKVKILEKK
jgi:hypothetical protein